MHLSRGFFPPTGYRSIRAPPELINTQTARPRPSVRARDTGKTTFLNSTWSLANIPPQSSPVSGGDAGKQIMAWRVFSFSVSCVFVFFPPPERPNVCANSINAGWIVQLSVGGADKHSWHSHANAFQMHIACLHPSVCVCLHMPDTWRTTHSYVHTYTHTHTHGVRRVWKGKK